MIDWKKDFRCFDQRLRFIKNQSQNYNSNRLTQNKELILHIIDIVELTNPLYVNRVVLTNSWVDPELVDDSRFEFFLPSFYALYQGRPTVKNSYPTHAFNCFIKRMDPIRQSWFYFLIQRGWLDQGLVSFKMDVSRHGHINSSPTDIFEQQYINYNSAFVKEHSYAKQIVPYCNFDDSDLNSAIMQTKYSIVLETYFDSNDCITFSEKIFRCLKLPRPWVLFCNLNAVAKLREYGFDVLDDIVDHCSYDAEINPRQRESLILAQCEILNNLEYTPKLMIRLEQAAETNNSLLEKFGSTFETDIVDAFNRAIAKC